MPLLKLTGMKNDAGTVYVHSHNIVAVEEPSSIEYINCIKIVFRGMYGAATVHKQHLDDILRYMEGEHGQ